ncbi:AvrD family protein [Lactococcus lactis]|uniref:AvrD family protein n=1 Tax=Lactococcus lactis TaxID=1358 RepID=UPI00345DEBAE
MISKLSVKAGNNLVENLKNVEAHLALSSDNELLFKGKVASFSVELTIELFDDSKQIIVSNREDYYFSAFETEENEVTDVSILPDLSGVLANADFQYDKTFSGVESAYLLSHQLPSILDQIIVTAQLTEILHARLDNIPREKSKTLIMRKIEFSRTILYDADPNNKTIKIEVLKTKMVHLRGKALRTSDMISKFGNSTFTYSVAQEISETLEEN